MFWAFICWIIAWGLLDNETPGSQDHFWGIFFIVLGVILFFKDD